MGPNTPDQSSPQEKLVDISRRTETRPATVPIRFAVGDLRLFTLSLHVQELLGHFLESPVTASDVMRVHQELGGRSPVLGRSIILSEIDRQFASSSMGVKILAQYDRHFVALRGTFLEYLGHFSSRSRSTLTRKVRKFQGAGTGEMDWSTYRHTYDVEPFLVEALPLSKRTYQHRLLGSGLPTTAEYRDHLRSLAAQDQFRGWILRLGGQPVAYICSEAIGRTLLYDYVGFDPDRADLSPGTVLQYLVLEQLFSERTFAYFDFTEGSGGHKELFGTDKRTCVDILVTNTSVSTNALLVAHRAFTRMSQFAARSVERVGLKSKLRRFLRRTG